MESGVRLVNIFNEGRLRNANRRDLCRMPTKIAAEVQYSKIPRDEYRWRRDSVLAPFRILPDKMDAENGQMRQYNRENPFRVATYREASS